MKERTVLLDVFFILILAALTIAFFQVLRPFLLDIFLAVIFTNLTWSLFTGLNKKLSPGFASFISVLIFFLITAGFISLIIFLFAREAMGGFSAIKSWWPKIREFLIKIDPANIISSIPFLNSMQAGTEPSWVPSVMKALESGVNTVIGFISKSLTNLSLTILHYILILFLMFFLYLEGKPLLRRIRELIPLSNENTDTLLNKIVEVTRATAVSTIVIGIIEGGYGCLLFAAFGLPAPVLWGIIMMIVSMIPLIGTNAVLVPAGIIMIASGRTGGGILMIILSLGGISASQYLLKPKLLGGRTGLHPVLVLLSILGGLAWLGLIGFIVGPITAALFIVIWDQFGERFKQELNLRNK